MRACNLFSITGFLFLVVITFFTTTASAGCGLSPDPKYDSTGYANWCLCMGGLYNYQTTACVGATGSKHRTKRAHRWYCRAQARNGAWGWGEYYDQTSARARALYECHLRSRGQACRIQYCN